LSDADRVLSAALEMEGKSVIDMYYRFAARSYETIGVSYMSMVDAISYSDSIELVVCRKAYELVFDLAHYCDLHEAITPVPVYPEP
jgi:hypothetical protein